LNNFEYRKTRKRLGHLSATLQELIQWCEEESEPEDPDEVFVAGLNIKKLKKSGRIKVVVSIYYSKFFLTPN
jgi:hypothetical protein